MHSIQNEASRWCHLHQIQIWSPGGATCISKLPGIALLVSSARIELASSSTGDKSVKSTKLCDLVVVVVVYFHYSDMPEDLQILTQNTKAV